jgi:nucleotide-binding universal stress UspA family protein
MRVSERPASPATNEARSRRPILVAIGEAAGTPGLRMAHALAERDGSPVVVVSVVEPPPLFALEARRTLLVPWTIDQQLAERGRKVQERLHHLGVDVRPAHAPHVDIAYGEPAREITRLAREHDARLIVMGIGPHTVARRLLAEGTAWATAQNAPCPVLAVAERAHGVPRVAVAAIDFGTASINAAHEAMSLLADGSVMHLVHAWRRIETVVSLEALDAVNAAYARALPAQFDLVRGVLGRGRPIAINTVVLEGKPADSVLVFARTHRADLIVAGAHGTGTLERWLLGSTATALLRGAETSVLLVPEPPTAEQMRLTRHMCGTSTARNSGQWNDELDAFVRRNRSRRTVLEIDALSIGAQVQESGYSLVGATYDRHDGHLALMFADGDHQGAHLTRSMAGVTSVSIATGAHDSDRALCIEGGDGAAVLTFLDPPAATC